MAKYIPSFGIEIHAELLTNTKAFSNTKIDFNIEPNTSVSPVDLGYPGSKPTVNKKMVEFSYRLAKVFKMNIENTIFFDRKSYFYPDLPKGFQITQFFRPIGKNGVFTISINGLEKDIAITEIHMEEDTAKQIKTDDGTLFDFNRAGIPLIEIVTDHKDLSSIEEVIAFIKQIRSQLVMMGINDGKLEEGSFRVDINVSIRPEGTNVFGTRTEVKNLNSFNNIRKALEEEIKRHEKLYEIGEKIESYTVRFDEETQKTIPMRIKDDFTEYNFIPEGNITPIKLTNEMINEFEEKSKSDFFLKFNKELKPLMNEKELSIIQSTKKIFDVFNKMVENIEPREAINFIVNDIKSMIKETKLKQIRIEVSEIEMILKLKKEGKIDTKKTNELILEMFEKDITSKLLELDTKILLNEKEIKLIINKLIESNSELIKKDIKERPERIEKFLTGQLMKETKGNASPQMANKLIKEAIYK